MMYGHPASEAWAEWWRRLDSLKPALARLATNVSSARVREDARDAVQFYFSEVRGRLEGVGVEAEKVADIDQKMQHMIELAAGVNRKSTYLGIIRDLARLRAPLTAAIEIRANAKSAPPPPVLLSHVEAAILQTLDKILPLTALSYRQAIQDLADQKRYSYRGVAAELREVLREVLDHLAPDADVMAAPGFKVERDQTKPTMKQKAVHVLKARGLNDTQRKPATDAIAIVEGAVGSLARAAYNVGSLATHISSERAEVLTFKGYADAVVAQLLEIHKT
jgi:hypothetical protein